MRVILMLGSRSKVNGDRLKEQRDSLDIETYETVKEMMESVTQRNVTFDRIVVSTASLNEERTMEVLHKFLRELHPRATVVLIYQEGKGEDIARSFNNIFNSPLYTDMVIRTNSISLLEESAVAGIDVLREKYSIRKYGETTDEDILEDSYPQEEKEKLWKSSNGFNGQPMLVLPQKKKQKKRTWLFGVKKLTKREMQILQINLRLVTDYLQYLSEIEDDGVDDKKYVIPEKEKRSKSDPVEEYKTKVNEIKNESGLNSVPNKNKSNSYHNPTFTPLEIGYYGFSTKFEGRPMMFRIGVRVTQQHSA